MPESSVTHLLAISGSLRATSSNTTVLRAAAALAPAGVEVALYAGLGDLPQFNPDLDDEGATPPPAVAELRARLRAADAVMISSPEYAHGVPGALKNALDWVVGSGELVDKPVALINAAPHSRYAHPSLAETLTVMSARVVAAASPTVPIAGRGLDERGVVGDAALAGMLRAAVAALVDAARRPAEDAALLAPPADPAALFLARSRHFLGHEYRTKLRLAIEAMPAAALWARANESSNSAGNLLMHLAGNVRQWIVAGVGGVDTAGRDRDGEFAARDGADAPRLLAALDAVLDDADAVLARLTAADLAERRAIQGRELTVLEAVYHVVEHFSLHLGQLILLAKQHAPAGTVRFYDDANGLAKPIWDRDATR